MPDSVEPRLAVRRLSELMRRVNSSTDTADVLEEIATGVVEVLGYGVAAIARLEGSMLVMTNVAGPDAVKQQILGRRTPADQILDEFRQADKWGILRFVPHGRMSDARRRAAWIPDLPQLEDADAWHPEDALYAPLYSATGELLGNMAVDLPPHGRIPGQAERELLEMFVVQAGLALSNAQQREQLTERLRLGDMMSQIARAGGAGGLEQILEVAAQSIAQGLRARQVWLRLYPESDPAPEYVSGYPYVMVPEDDILDLRMDLARSGTILTRPVEVTIYDSGSEELPDSWEALQSVLRGVRADRMMITRIHSGTRLIGYLAVAFSPSRQPISGAEQFVLREVTRELGNVVARARLLETEQRLVTELRELARYRSELMATISHELKTPLTAIIGHAEMLSDRYPDAASVHAITRNAQRLNQLVGNLLNYSRVHSRREALRQRVDLVELAQASRDLLEVRADTMGVHLTFTAPAGPVDTYGDPEELGTVIDNLVDNAVKYTMRGGRVDVSVGGDGDTLWVRVADTGLGISSFDIEHIFSPFHRSTNTDALSIPGTGLGLAISRRIATAQGGEIEVESEPGQGSVFTFRLPVQGPRPDE
ncbi:MAG: sensor histidine kinase [Nocardioides sp.]|uniref:sensor histidine kinase n=1 Tax=Nocardioides sp. TaxID=35761 RepID=UPI003F04AF60